MTRVVLLTDFGTSDGYAAAMAGVIAAAAPQALVEHASHDVAPGDIFGAALALFRFAFLYPPGTVHLAVVDPGVGTARRALAAAIDGRYFVGPDNGLFSFVLRDAGRVEMVAVETAGGPDEPAPTFHGRDLFAPAAARLAAGHPLSALGTPVSDPVLLAIPEPERDGSEIRGAVLQVDRFGSLITNIPGAWLEGARPGGRAAHVAVDGVGVGPLRRTYGDVEPGALVALVGSLGLVEVAVRDGRAADHLRSAAGSGVTIGRS